MEFVISTITQIEKAYKFQNEELSEMGGKTNKYLPNVSDFYTPCLYIQNDF